jgi:hypothetical protein
MPYFKVTGTSAKGRAVSKTLPAQTPAGARRTAEQNGITVESVERLPPEPATDRQLSYARSLGIAVPDGASLDQMSDLISRSVEPAASAWLVQRAKALIADLDPDRYFGVEYVTRQLNEVIGVNSPQFHRARAFWYLHGVLRHQRIATWLSPDAAGVRDDTMWTLVDAFVADSGAHKSMQRDWQSNTLYQLPEFGDGYGGTLSSRTAGYKRAAELLRSSGLI